MQSTRKQILEILKERGQATVGELVQELTERHGPIASVTVRYHLDVLRDDGLVEVTRVKRREGPGRPRYVYTLTDRAADYFPENYRALLDHLLRLLEAHFPKEELVGMMESLGRAMANQAGIRPDAPIEERLRIAVEFLAKHGYKAHWDVGEWGFALHITHCPYHHLAGSHDELCIMDTNLIAALLHTTPQKLHRITEGDAHCAYLIEDDAA